jgi:hypothetical protein
MNPVIIIAPIVGNFCAILFYSMTGADAEIACEWRKNHISGGWNSRPRDR